MSRNSPHSNVTVEDVAPDDYSVRTLVIEFLFLDRDVCQRCGDTETALHTALDRVMPLLVDLGVDVILRNIHIETETDARRTGFKISPTIRIDGRDIQPEPIQTPCETCSDLAGCCDDLGNDSGIDCRSWRYRGATSTTPPVALLVESLLRAALTDQVGVGDQQRLESDRLPENLETFFDDGPSQSATSTESSCCH